MTSRPSVLALAAAAALSTTLGQADELTSLHLPDLVNAEVTDKVASIPEAGGPVRVHGDRADVQVSARQATIATVLTALAATYRFSYTSSIPLDAAIDGQYAGSLGQVISRVLDGYNYVIKQENAKLDVIVFNKSGELADPSLAVPAFHLHKVPTTTRISRNR
jgi:hypothetical protein